MYVVQDIQDILYGLYKWEIATNAKNDGKNVFDQPVKKISRDQMKIFLKIATGQGGEYTTNYLLNYLYLKKHFKLIARDLSK